MPQLGNRFPVLRRRLSGSEGRWGPGMGSRRAPGFPREAGTASGPDGIYAPPWKFPITPFTKSSSLTPNFAPKP